MLFVEALDEDKCAGPGKATHAMRRPVRWELGLRGLSRFSDSKKE
jgi:hypothetical protein